MAIPRGLFVTPNFITEAEEQQLISWLDTQPWSTELIRRTQHYGYQYGYSDGKLQPTTPIAGPLLMLQQRFTALGYTGMTQCIINEYFRAQGIAPHIDRGIFGPVIMGISLGADAVMNFERVTDNGVEYYDCFLPRRSLLMLSDEARQQWKHGLRKTVTYLDDQGNKIVKPNEYRRISCTFRSVL